MIYILMIVISASVVSVMFFLLCIRSFQIKMRLTYPLRHALDATGLVGADYQNIFTMLMELNSSLRKRTIKSKLWKKINEINIVRVLTFRPLTYDFTRLHLNYAFANLSEISRDKFRTDKVAVEKLKKIFEELSDAIITDNHILYIQKIADYYRLLRKPDENNSVSSGLRENDSVKLVEIIPKIQLCLDKADTFSAYNYILEFKEQYDYDSMSSFEILALNYLSSKLECFIQGTKYFIDYRDIDNQLSDIKSHCVSLVGALKEQQPTMLLKAAA